jgi:putative flavoprotein involved in K+ transport
MTDKPDSERIETVVVGAGQAGLSAGYYLARRGKPFVIVDADARIGDHWRRHWDSLRLFTAARFDNLPGMRFPAPAWHYPSGREMGDYLESYAARFALPVESGIRVDRIEPADGAGGYLVTAGDRIIHADDVIVASGPFGTPHVPDFAADLDPSIRQFHSSEYRNPSQLADGPVLVVGVSHSGADIAYEVARSHRTVLSGRAVGELPFRVIDTPRARIVWPIVAWVQAHVLTIRTPIGRRIAPHLKKGGGPLLRVRSVDFKRAGIERHEARVTAVRDGLPMTADGQVHDVANVIWATGFEPAYSWIDVPGAIADDGWPLGIGRRGIVDEAPGLYFLGLPFIYAFSSVLVGGVGRDAEFVVSALDRRSRESGPAKRMAPAAAPR